MAKWTVVPLGIATTQMHIKRYMRLDVHLEVAIHYFKETLVNMDLFIKMLVYMVELTQPQLNFNYQDAVRISYMIGHYHEALNGKGRWTDKHTLEWFVSYAYIFWGSDRAVLHKEIEEIFCTGQTLWDMIENTK